MLNQKSQLLLLTLTFFPFFCCGTSFAQLPVAAQPSQPAGQVPSGSKSDDAQAARLEKLAKYLTNTRWTGQFTVTGKDTPPTSEHYEITQAIKAEEGDYWNLVVRIKYGANDTTLPLPPIEIKWAGETPVITVDKVTIPGLGTFDARVLIRGGQYAGTWSHDEVGGHLFGKIEKLEAEPQGSAKPEAKPAVDKQN